MPTPIDDCPVGAHYGRGDVGAAILEALRAARKNPDALRVEDLTPVDQFHICGREATLDLARRAGLTSIMRVLDIGGGVGGPARALASEIGCAVTVLDITEEYCRAGEMLTARTGLADRVAFRHGSALDLPFHPESFDAVWTQHSSMNIADKERLYAEIHRVLRPDGRLALHEIFAGASGAIHFPVPWAREASISHLRPASDMRALIERSGFTELDWVDESALALAWFRERAAAIESAGGPPPLGLHLLLGPDVGEMFRNQVRNLEEARVVVVQAVFERQP